MKRVAMILLTFSLLLSMTACRQDADTPAEASAVETVSAAVPAAVPEEAAEPEPVSALEDSTLEADKISEAQLIREVPLPLCEDTQTLSMWLRSNFMDMDPIQSNFDSPIFAKAEELTNVKIDFVEVSNASESETFNLMIAGGDYTDILYNFAKLYTGGVDSAIENDIIVDISEYLEETPCYQSLLASDDTVRKTATTDSGSVGAFYSIYESTPYTTTGLTMRGDWLEELGLDAPVTYEEFEQVLLAFKDAYDPKYPLYLPSCGTLSEITAGYGFNYSVAGDNVTMFSLNGDEVVFSPTSDAFRDYLTMMHRWYDEGLISRDFATDGDWMFMHGEYRSMLSGGDTGLVSLGGGLYSEFTAAGLELDDNYALVGVVNPRMDADTPAGSTPGARASDAIFSVSDCNGNAALACRWCDFWYTTEGSMLAGYGIEGESYTLNADGRPEYTDLILHNEAYSDRSMKNMYSFNASALVAPEKNLSGVPEDGLLAIEVWSGDTPSQTYRTLNMTTLSMTPEESTQYGIACSDALTYCLENVLRFIDGTLDLETDWAEYISVLTDMGVEDAARIVQNAYDRYLMR